MIPDESTAAEQAISRAHLTTDQDFIGTVHSVFPHACNIVVNDQLITIQDANSAHTPTSIRVAGPAGTRWSPTVLGGQPAWCRNGVLEVGVHSLGLAGIPVWAPSPIPRFAATGMDVRLEELARLTPSVTSGPDVTGLRPAVQRLAELVAESAADPRALTAAAAALVGVGSGLTPSGDDVLVGLLAAFMRGGSLIPRAAAAATSIARGAVARSSGTTDISQHYLRLAVNGYFGQPLTELVDTMVSAGPTGNLRYPAAAVLKVGASSGADAMQGLMIGLSAVARWHGMEQIPSIQERAA